jgi:hypothetical protein
MTHDAIRSRRRLKENEMIGINLGALKTHPTEKQNV